MSFVLRAWPEAAEIGRAEFNAGRYFEAHEHWEEIWHGASGPARDFWQGLIQVAGALLKVQRGEPTGALKLFDRGLAKLEPLVPAGAPVDLRALIGDSRQIRAEVEADPERVRQRRIPDERFPKLRTRAEVGGVALRSWPRRAEEGAVLFDAGKWWEAHEAFEAVMAEAPGDEPLVYKAILQSGSALHKLSQGKEGPGRVLAENALRLFDWLSPITVPEDAGVHVEAVRATLRWILAQGGLPDPVPRPRLHRP